MQDAKEDVRSRLAIEDVIGEYVQLKRAGRNFRGLSPFNQEKTPSFYVSPEKQIWHDFSSNKGGDIFSFVMEVEGFGFRESLELLAKKAGVDLSLYQSQGDQMMSKVKKRLLLAHQLAVEYYQQSLLKNQHALDYVLKKRGLNRQVIQDFKIGYAPNAGRALVNFLQKKGFKERELEQAGLVNRFGGDLFRGRIIIPLMDATGQAIGFTGRALVDDPKSPKYLNTSQTILYDKSRHVFGLSQAKEAIKKLDQAVFVEGNLDVISSHQAGIQQVVATAGTAMTEHHLRALSRLTSQIKLAFDGDRAGILATERAIMIAQSLDLNILVVSMPEGVKDPDDLIRQDKKLWLQAIEQAEPAIDWVLSHYRLRHNLTTAQGKSKFTSEALKLIRALEDPVVREHYLEIIARDCETSVRAITQKIRQIPLEERTYKPVKVSSVLVNDNYAYQDNILAIACLNQRVREALAETTQQLLAGEVRQVISRYLAGRVKNLQKTPPSLQKYDNYVKILLLKAEERYSDWSEQDQYYEATQLLKKVEHENKKQTVQDLSEQLRQAEEKGDKFVVEKLLKRLNKTIKEKK